jgi:hypothetical protein
MLGPKPFALDRMMAIFYSIVEGRVAPTANIFMQVYIVELSFFNRDIKTNHNNSEFPLFEEKNWK